jgi:hypothetical protein
MRWLSRRMRYSNVMSTIAVFIALGGASYAAVTLPKNSVGTKQIKKNAVTSAKVKNGSLLSADFKLGQLPAGPQGATGPTGPQGPKGDTGTVDTSNIYTKSQSDGRYLRGTVVVVKTIAASVSADSFEFTTVDCPAGYQAIGGGVDVNGVYYGKVSTSAPTFGTTRTYLEPDGQQGPATGWEGAISTQGTATGTGTAKVAVICAPIG